MTQDIFSLIGESEPENNERKIASVKTTSKASYMEMIVSGEIQAISDRIVIALQQLPGNRGIKSVIAKKCRLKEEQVHKRLSELKKQGIIIETGKSYRSKITMKLQTEWQLTA